MTLEAARDSRLADAHAEADRIGAQAAAEAAARAAEARRRADAFIGRAREQGTAEGQRDAAADEAAARVRARGEVLAARREAYDQLCHAARAAVMRLRDAPEYPEVLDRLADAARGELGAAADLEIDPPEAGGVRARAGSRRIDATLPALADRAIADLGPTLGRLWS
jgi:vacuolar-type H+-ATPase subunit E/Vma4